MASKVRFGMVKSDSAVPALASNIIAKFNKELGHINMDDIQFAWRFSDRSRYHGKTRLIRGEDKMFTSKKIVIVLWLRSWKAHKSAWRALLVYHELRHVLPPKNDGGDYRLVRHDIEDFIDIVDKYGPRWENADAFLTKLEKKGG